jgi:hypothetical protein
MTPRHDDRNLVSAVDLAPTVMAACGLAPPAGLPGVNLLDHEAVTAREAVFGATYTHDAVDVDRPLANLRARWCIAGRWKLILPFRRNRPDDSVELYDVVADPRETRNLAAAHSETLTALRQRLDEWWPVADPPPPKLATPPATTIACEFNDDVDGWSPARQIRAMSLENGCLVLKASGNDPIITFSPCRIDPASIARVRVRMAADAGSRIEFRWGTEAPGHVDPGKVVGVPLVADGAFHEYVLPVGEHPQWTGKTVLRLRFDPADAAGTSRIDWMRGEGP